MAERRLTSEQCTALDGVRARLRSEADAGRRDSGDAVLRGEIDEWITQILARSGRLCPEAEKRFGYVVQEAPRGGSARRYAEEVDAVLTEGAPGAVGRSPRGLSLGQTLGASVVTFLLLLALHRVVFHHTWGDAAGTAAAFSVAWVVCQGIFRWLSARTRRTGP